ncbi:MAG TPA: hypothetical protein VI199_09025, partial [Novosphingobium sp.]
MADFPPRALRARSPLLRGWKPLLTSAGATVLFNGALDNAAQLAEELGLPRPTEWQRDRRFQARVYGEAVARWGDATDQRMIGHYCAVVDDPASGLTRLSRSPYYGPPLHYFVTG